MEQANDIHEKLRHWRQGDYALDVGGFVFAGLPEGKDAKFDAHEITDEIVGLTIISQTCDVVRMSDDKMHVSVCPLVRCTPSRWKEISIGRFPSLVSLEHAPEAGVFVDLARVMSVSKPLLVSWERKPGFTDAARSSRFAAAIERKFGRFAFPDEFDVATKAFQERVRSRHGKGESPIGHIYRSLDQLRFRASPCWQAEHVAVTLIGVLKPPDERLASDEQILEELRMQTGAVEWPASYSWAEPAFFIATASELRASDIFESQLADFEYLSAAP